MLSKNPIATGAISDGQNSPNSVSADVTLTLTGVETQAALGTLGVALAAAIAGASSVVQRGTLSPSALTDITLSLTGIGSTVSVGNLTKSMSMPLAGQDTQVVINSLSVLDTTAASAPSNDGTRPNRVKQKRTNLPNVQTQDNSYLERIFGNPDAKIKKELRAAAPTELTKNAEAFNAAAADLKATLQIATQHSATVEAERRKQLVAAVISQRMATLEAEEEAREVQERLEEAARKRRKEEEALIKIVNNLF